LQRSRRRLRAGPILRWDAGTPERGRGVRWTLRRRRRAHRGGGGAVWPPGPDRPREHGRWRPHQFPRGEGAAPRHVVATCLQEVRERRAQGLSGSSVGTPSTRYSPTAFRRRMVRLRRPPEWGVEPVPASLRVLRTFDLFILWSSLGAGLLVLAAGALLVPIWGGVTMGLALGGPLAVVRNWLERFAIWIVYGSTIAVAIALGLHRLDLNVRPAPVAGRFAGTASLLLGLDLVVAMPIS